VIPYYQDDWCTVYHGDCRDIDPGDVDCVFTDPPYGQNETYGREGQGIANDEDASMYNVVGELVSKHLKEDRWSGVWVGWKTFSDAYARLKQEGYPPAHCIAWDKVIMGMGQPLRTQYELLMVLKKGKAETDYNGPDVWQAPRQQKPIHPNEKALPVISKFLFNFCPLGGVVLDPFMGSGTTLRVAKNLNLKAIGIDLEERYCAMAADRSRQEVLDFG
jgi:site-specific DNA-methyltransferase (adenine-specific)